MSELDKNNSNNSPFVIAVKAKHDNPVRSISKNRKIKELTLPADKDSSNPNFFTKKNSAGFLPVNYESKSGLSSPKNNPLLSPVLLSSTYSQPYAAITSDSIDFSKEFCRSSSLNMSSYHTQQFNPQLNAIKSSTTPFSGPGGQKLLNPSGVKSMKQQLYAKSLEKSLMQTRW